MKHTIVWILVAVAAGALGSLVTYRITYRNAYHQGQIDLLDTETGATGEITLGTLRKLRAGDLPGATRLLESFSFGESQAYFHGRTDYRDSGHELLAQELLQYRAVYRTNAADWNAFERKLDTVLVGMKQLHSTGWDITWSGKSN